MHSSVQRKDSGNKKSKSYKDLPFGPSVIIGSQKTQIYQRFTGSQQEGFILIYGQSCFCKYMFAANLLLNFTAEWDTL